MKRIGNIYQEICCMANLRLADRIARRGKANQQSIIRFDKNHEANLLKIQHQLLDKAYATSPYTHFTVHDPKERQISSLPYRDRIVHHAIMNIIEPMFVANFTADTYSCIKGRGIHKAATKLFKALRTDPASTEYCLKLDVTKFYPSINHDILKALLRRKIKDNDLLWLLDEIIDSAPGVPIGNYLSQYFANFYLSPLDHFIKETLGIKHYWRYADDIVILANNKSELHKVLASIRAYLQLSLKLSIKGNYQVFPVSERGIDFLGYVFYHTHIYLRKSIKQSWARAVKKGKNRQSLAAYHGWAKHCNAKNLLKTLSTNENIQRPRHQIKDPDRRQDPDRTNNRSADNSLRFPDKRQSFRKKERSEQMSLFTN